MAVDVAAPAGPRRPLATEPDSAPVIAGRTAHGSPAGAAAPLSPPGSGASPATRPAQLFGADAAKAPRAHAAAAAPSAAGAGAGAGGGGVGAARSRPADFELQAELGRGTFARVFRAGRKRDGRTYAVKRVRLAGMKPRELADTLGEIRFLASLRHPRLIAYHDAFYDEAAAELWLVMEYAQGGDLAALVARHVKAAALVPEPEVRARVRARSRVGVRAHSRCRV